jgi:hypothetical protein
VARVGYYVDELVKDKRRWLFNNRRYATDWLGLEHI